MASEISNDTCSSEANVKHTCIPGRKTIQPRAWISEYHEYYSNIWMWIRCAAGHRLEGPTYSLRNSFSVRSPCLWILAGFKLFPALREVDTQVENFASDCTPPPPSVTFKVNWMHFRYQPIHLITYITYIKLLAFSILEQGLHVHVPEGWHL